MKCKKLGIIAEKYINGEIDEENKEISRESNICF